VVLGRVDRSPYQKLLIELAGPERFLIDLYTESDPVVGLIELMSELMDEQVRLAIESEAEEARNQIEQDAEKDDTGSQVCPTRLDASNETTKNREVQE